MHKISHCKMFALFVDSQKFTGKNPINKAKQCSQFGTLHESCLICIAGWNDLKLTHVTLNCHKIKIRISWYVHTCSTYKSAQRKSLKAVDRSTSRAICTMTSVYPLVIHFWDNVQTTPNESIMTSGRVSDDII